MNSYLKLDELRDKLRELTGLGYMNGARNELICRCPLPNCELEVGKTYNYGRLYIDAVKSPVWHCFRCGQSGTIFKLLNYLKLDKAEFLNLDHEVFKYKGRCVIVNTSNFLPIDIYNNLKVEVPVRERYREKFTYLQGRLGIDSDVERIPRIIFNIRDFINDNGIELKERDEQFLEIYESQYIGFLSNRGTVLTLRKAIGEGADYHRLQIINSGNFKDFYGVATGHIKKTINKVVFCEGVFDLLVGIKTYELQNLLKDSCYWAAALGSHYRALLASILDHIKLPYVDVVVLTDRDKKPSDPVFDKLKKSPMVRNLEIYWNKLGHDFGARPIMPVKTVFQQQTFKRFKKKEVQPSFR